ncbi:MAG: 23S rRNA (uracil(1939)-C(5))-methyltransferase RlmD [Flavobacteriia bacterium]|nr:23S rRNA (uracil(1939)-C(5))-methyltransferase RlmD [Flavobacteriia bacterium]
MKKGDIIELEIHDFAFGGKGISRQKTENGDFILFVENTFPGQKVKAKVENKKKNYAECKLIEIIHRSSVEKHLPFQEISGAPYLFVPIELQKEKKLESTLQIFKKIGKIPNIESFFDEWIASPESYFYRNKMEYSFSCIEHDLETGNDIDDAFALGFKRRGTWWKVESLNRCSGLFDEDFENNLKNIREFLKNSGLLAWHPPQKKGFFRHLVVRKSFYSNQLLINLVSSSESIERFDSKAFVEYLLSLFDHRIAGILHTINDDVADRNKIENGSTKLLYGQDILTEKISDLYFEISMESFFQTNPKCAEKLYQKAIDYVFENEFTENDTIMDLFCGTGTIGQLIAKRNSSAKIIGIDIVEEAIEDAKRNIKRNQLNKQIQFFSIDVGKFLHEHPEYKDKIHTLVLDPPRAGIAPKTLQKIILLQAKNIVYISCNPATQARDIDTLQQAGYQIEKFSLVDQFPHTGHIESVMKLSWEMS